MALKFKCNHCDTEIISKFLKVGEEAKCKFCGTSTLIPDNAEEVDDNEYDKYTTKLKKVKIAPSVNNDKPATIKQSEKIKQCISCGTEYDFVFHGKCPDCKSDKVGKVKDNDGNKVEKKQSLSSEYSILEFYKGLAFLLMIAATGFFIYSLVQFFDAPKAARKILENAIIISTVSYFITMFSLFCLTKIIDFLFDLDKQYKILAPDKISSEEE